MTTRPDLGAAHRLILVRHGRTAHTVADLISGSGFLPQPGLDSEGRAQARAAAGRLAAWTVGPVQMLTSPQQRARETAAQIAGAIGVEPVADPAWAEAHFGEWEGLSVADVVANYPGAWEAMIGDPMLGPPQGETLDSVRQRVLAAWEGTVRPGSTTVVVTHLTPIRVAVTNALAIPHEAFGRVMARPGSVTVIDRWTDGGCLVITVGESP